MPIYGYECAACGPFTAFRSMVDYAKPAACDTCGEVAPRAVLNAPAIAGMDAGVRRGLATNEKSRHEPRRSSGAHPSGCGCCSTARRSKGTGSGVGPAAAMPAAKSFAGRRPWMISH